MHTRPWSRGGLLRAVLLLIVAWLGSGCIVLEDRWPVASQSSGRDHRRPYLFVWVEGEGSMRGVPWVFEHYGYKPPYDVDLSYTTHNLVTEPEIRFEDVSIRFRDGTVTNLTKQFQSGFVLIAQEDDYVDGFRSDRTPIRRRAPSLRGSRTIEHCLPKRMPFTMHIKGALWSGGQPVEQFSVEMTVPIKRETKVMHKLQWLARQSI